MNKQRLTDFFAIRGWQVPWDRIGVILGGWFLPISNRLCGGGIDAATLVLGARYEIHHNATMGESLLAHELAHIRQAEKDRGWVWKNIAEQMRYGYKRNRYEVEARRIADEYMEYMKEVGQ